MRLINNNERLEILYLLSDQLWSDLESGEIKDYEYITRIDSIRQEMRREINFSFIDMQGIASEIGYILTKKQNVFGVMNTYSIIKN